MFQDWRKELNRVLLLIVVAGVLGAIFNAVLLFILLPISAYLLYTLLHLRRLQKWLLEWSEVRRIPPPESSGIWGDVFDSIYRLQERERLANEELQSILTKAQESSAALKIGVILIDKSGDLDWWNKSAEHLLGLRYPGDRRMTVTNLIRDPRFADYFQSRQYQDPLIIESPLDERAILEFQLALYGESERLMVVRDISKVHKLEMMRKDFVANVSHELRTPITVISGYLETFVDNLESFQPEWRKPLQQIQQQSHRMEQLIKDLLMLSQLETKAITKHQTAIDVLALLQEARNDAIQAFTDKAHVIDINCPAGFEITGDRGELYSAVSNLVFNAAKYSPEGGHILIGAEKTLTAFLISVADDGIGLEPQHIPRLTERFYRVDASRSTTTGGTGLGLAIVKHVLMRHDGSLQIHSEIGKGSKFICQFPLSRLRDESALAAESISI